MKSIDFRSVVVSEGRQRTEFDQQALSSLATSLLRNGQIHAIVLENDEKTIRAGERRLRACGFLPSDFQLMHDGVLLPPNHIAYTSLSELSEAALYEIELEENIQRVDISWQDRVRATERLYELHALRAGNDDLPVIDFVRAVKTVDDTASDAFYEKAKKDLRFAKHLNDPDVAKAKTQKEAANIIKRKQGDILQQELAARVAEQGFSLQASKHSFFKGSAFDIAPTLPSHSFDIIITDPPYGIDMDTMSTQSNSSSGLTHDYKDDEEYAHKCVSLVASEGMRVTKASAVCYMFCDIRFFYRWQQVFESHGWYVWPNPIIWDKSPVGSLLGSANGPRHCYETILMAIKNGKGVMTVGTDVVKIPGPQKDKLHPAEKPVELYSHLLAWSASPGDNVLDFFCGCGPIFPAASNALCYATGIERSETHAATALVRKDKTDGLL